MRKCTKKEKIAGEWAARKLNQEAWNMYVETDPLDIYEYINEAGDKRYSIRGALGDVDDLTFSEMEWFLESMYDELNNEF